MKQLIDFAKICPEAVFIPTYPQIFKIDLILDNKNYGQIEVEIKEELNLSSVKGTDEVLKKLDEIAKKNKEKFFCNSAELYNETKPKYPLTEAMSFYQVLRLEESFSQKGDFLKLADFICNVLHPINTEILYQKTGIYLTD